MSGLIRLSDAEQENFYVVVVVVVESLVEFLWRSPGSKNSSLGERLQ